MLDFGRLQVNQFHGASRVHGISAGRFKACTTLENALSFETFLADCLAGAITPYVLTFFSAYLVVTVSAGCFPDYSMHPAYLFR